MADYCQKNKIMWALDAKVPMPSEEDLKKMPIENTPKEKEEEKDVEKEAAKKAFPFMIRRITILPTRIFHGNDVPTRILPK